MKGEIILAGKRHSKTEPTQLKPQPYAVSGEKPRKNTEHPHKFIASRKYFTICIYAIAVIAIGGGIIYMIYNWKQTRTYFNKIGAALSPFILAFFIAYFLYPLVKKIDLILKRIFFKERFKKSRRILSVILSYLIVIGSLSLIVIYVTPQIGNSFSDLSTKVPAMYKSIQKYSLILQEKFPDINVDSITDTFQKIVPNLISYGTNMAGNLFPALYSLSIGIVKGLINLIVAVMVSIYMILDKPILLKNIKRFVYAVLPQKKADSFWRTSKECNDIFGGFVIGKMIDSLIIGIISFICMRIFQFPYALLLSLIVGITNMIPYFGPFIGAIPGVLIYLLTDPLLALFYAIFILVLQQFDGIYLGPKILGEKTGIRPLWVIFGITLGGAYAGVIGMFLGVPFTAVISFLVEKWVKRRLMKKNLTLEN